jgi:hypothetical protein
MQGKRGLVWMTALAVVLLTSSAGICGGITIIGTVTGNGYQFINFDGPTPNSGGTTINGISNNGTVVGFTTGANGNLTNFTGFPQASAATILNINGSMTAMANGINSAGTVVGADGNGNAFTLQNGVVTTFIPGGGTSAMAFGINDKGQIVGQYTTAMATPGFIRSPGGDTSINAPSGPNAVNAQGINNNGQVAGFYLGNDGQAHGFTANAKNAVNGTLMATAIADPTIPTNVPGEPGATFVFSQMLGINDRGIVAGYYGDSTTSQHGYLYNSATGQYTFLDDPSEAFSNGVEVTQITGISNSGEITGFYTDANGIAHGFIAFQQGVAVPEPGSLILAGVAMAAAVGYSRRRVRQAPEAESC